MKRGGKEDHREDHRVDLKFSLLSVRPICCCLSAVAGHCDENKDMLAPQEHETAKKDFGCFLTLIEMAIGYYAAEAQDVANHTLH